jgi:hypothetical protein
MTVWTRGSAGRRSAAWMWLATLIHVRIGNNAGGSVSRGVEDAVVDDVPEELRSDVALSVPLPTREDDLWARIAAARLPPL